MASFTPEIKWIKSALRSFLCCAGGPFWRLVNYPQNRGISQLAQSHSKYTMVPVCMLGAFLGKQGGLVMELQLFPGATTAFSGLRQLGAS